MSLLILGMAILICSFNAWRLGTLGQQTPARADRKRYFSWMDFNIALSILFGLCFSCLWYIRGQYELGYYQSSLIRTLLRSFFT